MAIKCYAIAIELFFFFKSIIMIGLYIVVIYMIIQTFYLTEFLVAMISYGSEFCSSNGLKMYRAFYFLVTLNASFTLQTRKR